MRARLILGLASLVLALAACVQNGDAPAEYRLFAMGTWVDLTLPPAAVHDRPELLREIESELRAFERDYYAWADGELAALNRALSAGRAFEASAELAGLLAEAQRIEAATEGAFDPGVGALVELWGFHGSDDPPPTPPAAAVIYALAGRAGSIADLSIDGTLIRAAEAEYTLDLGGIAKGEAVDRIVAKLGERGIAPALVNAGGDLRVVGAPAERAWRIGILAPRREGLIGTLRLVGGEAAFTSGDYERYVERDGQRLHHILDPRTGYPVTHTQAVTVLAANGVLADAAATALFVVGPAGWERVAEGLGIEAALRVDATGRIEMTASMRDRFQIDADEGSDIIILGH